MNFYRHYRRMLRAVCPRKLSVDGKQLYGCSEVVSREEIDRQFADDRHWTPVDLPIRRTPEDERRRDAYEEARRLRELRHREIAERSMWDADAMAARVIAAGCFVCVALTVIVVVVYAS